LRLRPLLLFLLARLLLFTCKFRLLLPLSCLLG
jgi:hypothetical protein